MKALALRPDPPITAESIQRAKFARDRERERVFQATGVLVNDSGSISIYDCTPRHLAVVFGQRAIQMMQDGRNPREAARLAFYFAQQVLGSVM